jgi:hypothetical protein
LKSSVFGSIDHDIINPAKLCKHFFHFFWQQYCYANVSTNNAIRPGAAGKKNWWFIGHPEAAWRSLSFMAVVQRKSLICKALIQ